MGFKKWLRPLLLGRTGGESLGRTLLKESGFNGAGETGEMGKTESDGVESKMGDAIGKPAYLAANEPQKQPERTIHLVPVEKICEAFRDMDDVIMQQHVIQQEPLTVFYMNSLVQGANFQRWVFDPLKRFTDEPIENRISSADKVAPDDLDAMVAAVLTGHSLLVFPGLGLYLKAQTYEVQERAITVSENESTIMGPQDSFTETMETNMSLIKRRLCSPHLKTRSFMLGTDARTSVNILYMDNFAKRENVDRLIRQIEGMKVNGLVSMAKIRQLLESSPFSLFPQYGLSVRPDLTVSALMNGKLVILTDGDPEATVCPVSFFELFVSQDDSYARYMTVTLLRVLRFGGFFLTIFLSSLYVSVLTYHPEMLPPPLLTLLSESRTKVPFPPVIEVLIIEVIIDILREAGTRMPTKIGQTIGIVGGIVIGTAAVQAGLASNILIVIVATSALLSFLPSNYAMSSTSRVLRYLYIFAAGLMGLYGQFLVFAWMMAHLSNLTSLGTPFFSPIPRKWSDWTNFIFRMPYQYMTERMWAAKERSAEEQKPEGRG
ncbi:spore germination protein [Paenibacillus sp. MBLB4367]|uniref:spore germination protein n=1 Tax=Paenibacillus sp. MBLB4367 TaxID=3384767 RepID=UPI00390818E3